MKLTTPNIRPLSLILSVLGPLSLAAQVSFDGTYEQDFNSLPLFEGSSGTETFNFTNNSTLQGWYSSIGSGLNEGRSSGGSAASTGSIYNWGRNANRALGTFDSNGYGGDTEYFGVQLVNNSGGSISGVSLEYVIEKWRNDVNETTWTLEYLVTSSTSNEIAANGYSTVTGSSISTTSASAGGANGDWSGNQTNFDLSIEGLNWQEGDSLWLRWTNDQPQNGGGFGLDDLSVSSIPEPEMSGLFLLLAPLFFLVRRSRR